MLLLAKGMFKEAAECFKKLIDELNVRRIDIMRHAAMVSLMINDLESAERYIKYGLEIRDDDVFLWYYKGELYERLGKLEDAIKCYEKVLELDPNHTNALLNMARIYEKLGDIEKAIDYYNKALNNKK